MKHTALPRGFTLIEMMVAVTIFSIVMLVGVGALLSLVEANRRAQAINSVMSNLNAAIEAMSRAIRVGTVYHCRTSAVPPPASELGEPRDCASGDGLLLAFESSTGDLSDDTDQTVFRLNGQQLERSLDAGGTWVALTAPEVSVESFEVFVVGSGRFSSGDTIQPRVILKIEGSAPVPGGETRFSVQAGVSQRLIDL